jgi:copper chaperone NosL
MSGPRLRVSEGAAAIALVAAWLACRGCAEGSASGPPVVHLGDSICAECGMIISDARFASATIVTDERGPVPVLFDDFNCQSSYESGHRDRPIVARWSHDYDSGDWINMMEGGFILRSPNIESPMASHMAAFRTRDGAEAAKIKFGGEVIGFDQVLNEPEP